MQESIINIVILISFLIEVVVLLKLEKVLWGTYYTPLNFLMIPYTGVVLINILLPVSLDFYPFYFPSILVWSIGLIVFFIPSLLLGLIYNKHKPEKKEFSDPATFKPLYIIGFVLLAFTLFYLYGKTLSLVEIIGSDEFADETLAKGVWAHIREVLLAVMILSIYFVNKNRAWLFILIFGVFIVSITYQVKTWIFVPIFAGIIMRLIAKKSTLKLKYILYTVIGGFAVFFLSYFLLYVSTVDDGELDSNIMGFIYNHSIFYLISGTAGFGADLKAGILEQAHPEYIFAPFCNLFSLIDGRSLVVPINSLYIDIGWAGSNVRTFFGTLYVNLGLWWTICYVLICSTVIYSLLFRIKHKPSLWALSIFSFINGLLALGWFDFYFEGLSVIEIPLILLLFSGLMSLKSVSFKNNDSIHPSTFKKKILKV
jgi:hypothetical protein